MCALWIHGMLCALSKLDRNLRNGLAGDQLEYEMSIVSHFHAMASLEIEAEIRALHDNADVTMKKAAAAALKRIDTLPNAHYSIPERTPDAARGTGLRVDQTHIPQFGAGSVFAGPKVSG